MNKSFKLYYTGCFDFIFFHDTTEQIVHPNIKVLPFRQTVVLDDIYKKKIKIKKKPTSNYEGLKKITFAINCHGCGLMILSSKVIIL